VRGADFELTLAIGSKLLSI